MFGSGQADAALTADGVSVTFVFGYGEIAALEMEATGTQYAILHALAQAAEQALSAGADGILATLGQGTAIQVLTASGEGTRRVLFIGAEADLALGVSDHSVSNIAILGAGQTQFVATASHGIPKPHVRPTEFVEANSILIVSDDNRLLTVAKEANCLHRPLVVSDEIRVLTVPDELEITPLRARRPLVVARGDRRV